MLVSDHSACQVQVGHGTLDISHPSPTLCLPGHTDTDCRITEMQVMVGLLLAVIVQEVLRHAVTVYEPRGRGSVASQ